MAEQKFEDKLTHLLDKYAKVDDEYYFTYEKITSEEFTIIAGCDISSRSGSKKLYFIKFDNEELGNIMQTINEDDPDLYQTPPSITTTSLYYMIQNMRDYQKKHNCELIKSILNFTEELFEKEYAKIDNMINKGIIDHQSLWYYLDRIDTVYCVEKLEGEKVCFKYKYFTYSSELENDPLVLYGSVYYPLDGTIGVYIFRYLVNKFIGTKKLSSLKITKIENDDSFVSRGKRIVNLYQNIHHMYLNGKQYCSKGTAILCYERSERVIVDYVGMHKYSNIPFDYPCEEEEIDISSLSDDDLMTMFPFVSIYNLGINKRWGMVNIDSLSEITYNDKAFDYLVLDENKKYIIKNLINYKNSKYQDFIDRKGDGLVFLLYGTSGTGKTLTAEAACDFLKKPLYKVNVADLGTDPETMETVMNRILEYADRWGAIILIDEVDVFLEERDCGSIIRNAMVGVFLKLLDYHDGILFLTTNRLTSLDSAIKSRINLMLSYEELTDVKREKIWSSLFSKWDIKLKRTTIKKLSRYNLNGREIRNYIRIVLNILESQNKEISDNNILTVIDDCFQLTEEFNKKIKSGLYL